jgi:hypothetical protein
MVEKAAVSWSRVLVSVVPAWRMGKEISSTRPQCHLRAAMMGKYFSVFFFELNVATEVLAEADLDDDEGALFSVKRGRVGGGSVWAPSCVDEVW